MEANRYFGIVSDLAQQLRAKNASALETLVPGHESLLLSPPVPVKQAIPPDATIVRTAWGSKSGSCPTYTQPGHGRRARWTELDAIDK
jgi:hypothetical protein